MNGKNKKLQGPYFALPEFDVPQKESPCLAQWTYEKAIQTFEELAETLKLSTPTSLKNGKPEERFEL